MAGRFCPNGRSMRVRERSGLVFATILILFGYTSTLRADEPLVPIHLGETIFAVPPVWLQMEAAALANGLDVDTVSLTPPPQAFDGEHGVSADGIDWITVLLHVDSGNERRTFIEDPLSHAAEKFGPVQPEEAAVAFDDILFDTLRGGPTLNAGKSVTNPVIFIGSVTLPEFDTAVVSARIDPTASADPARRYTISALFDAQGNTFVMMVSLATTRPLRTTDLGLVSAIADVIEQGEPN